MKTALKLVRAAHTLDNGAHAAARTCMHARVSLYMCFPAVVACNQGPLRHPPPGSTVPCVCVVQAMVALAFGAVALRGADAQKAKKAKGARAVNFG